MHPAVPHGALELLDDELLELDECDDELELLLLDELELDELLLDEDDEELLLDEDEWLDEELLLWLDEDELELLLLDELEDEPHVCPDSVIVAGHATSVSTTVVTNSSSECHCDCLVSTRELHVPLAKYAALKSRDAPIPLGGVFQIKQSMNCESGGTVIAPKQPVVLGGGPPTNPVRFASIVPPPIPKNVQGTS